jgi:hypothetical protein
MGWLDPESWKAPATLVDYWKTIAGGLVVIGGAMWSAIKWGRASLAWVRSSVRRLSPQRDRPLRFVADDIWANRGSCRRKVKDQEQEGTFLRSGWHVTNVSDRNIVVLKARLVGHDADYSHTTTRHPKNSEYGSRNPILARSMSSVIVDMQFYPPICSGS